MLYVTTRDNRDAYTVHKTFLSDAASDGGMFVPFHLPVYTQGEMDALSALSTGEIIADVLNRFFSARLTGWAIDLAIGRNTLTVNGLSQKIFVSEPWHNAMQTYDFAVNSIYNLLTENKEVGNYPTNWVKLAVKIAFIFATYHNALAAEILDKNTVFDIAVNTEDFSNPMAAWYAKQMGVPVGMILCSCTGNDGTWDLIHRGQLAFGSVSKEMSAGIERLICSVYGVGESCRFVQAAENKKSYCLDPETQKPLSDTFFCAVMSQSRADTVSNSVQRTDDYKLCSTGALAYGAIQDYRAKTGEKKLTLLFSDQIVK